MSDNQLQSVGFALRRLRVYVSITGWIVAFALFIQLVVASLVTFTDMRFMVVEPVSIEVLVPEVVQETEDRIILPADPEEVEEAVVAGPMTITTRADYVFRDLMGAAQTGGTIALLMMELLLGVTVMLVASAALRGVDHVLSAWIWSILVFMVVLPMGTLLDLPWQISGLQSYVSLTETVEVTQGLNQVGPIFYAKTLGVPAACLIALFFSLSRFRFGIEISLPKDTRKLDPHLEREAGNVKATSHQMGGRSGHALKRAMKEQAKGKQIDEGDGMPRATEMSAGERPRRLI